VVYIIISIGVRAAPLFENEQLVSGERKQETVRKNLFSLCSPPEELGFVVG
jgi:hypothetical protein